MAADLGLKLTDAEPQLLIAIETLGGGGAERVALDLAWAWPHGHARPVLLVALRTGIYADRLPPGLEVIEIGISTSPRKVIPFLWRLRQRLAGRRIAGVMSHMTGMNRMMLRAALFGILRAPVVVVEHNDFSRNQNISAMPWFRSFLLMRETGFLYRRAAAVVGCSQGVARQAAALFHLHPSRVWGIPNPVEPRFAAPAPMTPEIAAWFAGLERPIFVSVGRMVPQKGFDDLIRAFALQLKGSLVILGEGPLRANLSTLAEGLGVGRRVRMPGFLPAPEQVLQAADVYVSASLWEGYPLALIEAYAAGLPVVARACDFGPEEIVIPGRPGRLVRSGRIEDLAVAMTEVASIAPRVAPGSIPMRENVAAHVAARYRALFLDAPRPMLKGNEEKEGMMMLKRVMNRLGRPLGVNPFPRAFPNPIEGRAGSAAAVFDEIYRINYWNSSESQSGLGSELAYTRDYRLGLARCLADHGIGSIFDAPCGDLNWMANFLVEHPIAYAGGDISSEVVARAKANHPELNLRVFDITSDPFPEADLWHCRDCLFHLPFEAIHRSLTNFATSGIGHALITSHRAKFLHRNLDVGFGGFRFLDLERAPFFLPPPVARIPDYRRGHDFPRYVCLWSRGQIAEALVRQAVE